MPLLYRIGAAGGSTHFSSPPYRAGHSNAVFRKPIEVSRDEGLKIIRDSPDANLGWRIILEIDKPSFTAATIRKSVPSRESLATTLPSKFCERIKEEAQTLTEPAAATPQNPNIDTARPLVKFTTFEGSKGLTTQHVFIVGLHEGDLPRLPTAINDLEVCKMIVAVTRTRKQCHLIYTKRWANGWKRPSPFLSWIQAEKRKFVKVTKDYW